MRHASPHATPRGYAASADPPAFVRTLSVGPGRSMPVSIKARRDLVGRMPRFQADRALIPLPHRIVHGCRRFCVGPVHRHTSQPSWFQREPAHSIADESTCLALTSADPLTSGATRCSTRSLSSLEKAPSCGTTPRIRSAAQPYNACRTHSIRDVRR